MSCEDVREALMEIAVDEIPTLESHLEGCPECRALAERVVATDSTVGRSVDSFANQAGFDRAFQRALEQSREAERLPAPRRAGPWMAAAGLAVGLAAAAGLVLFVQSLPTSIALPGGDIAVVEPGPDPLSAATPTYAGGRTLEERAALQDARARAEAAKREAEAAVRDRERSLGIGPPIDPLVDMEASAILGRLTPEQIAELDAMVTAPDSRHSTRNKASRVLMVNAFSAGDVEAWERWIVRHLNQIEQSDPDLCYKYALYLSKEGWQSAEEVIHWADVALVNRADWSGQTYIDRVYSLYKIRAAAAQKLWQHAAEQLTANPTPAADAAALEARNRTKVYAREWVEYARVAGKTSEGAYQMCVSAAGTGGYCDFD